MVMPAAPGSKVLTRRIADDDPYFNDLSARWGDLLADAAAIDPRSALHGGPRLSG